MNPIRTNKPVFFGNDGEVLKSGMIYIGQPNQWPISFPKTVTFQDSAGSQFTAQQPMRTNGQGQIEYNGKAIIALVDGDYSMLVRDRNGVNVNDGYTPFIENSAADADLSSVTQVGLLLSDIKQFDVTPGETVRNVGKSTTLDGLGADWLVVSATGSPADDVDLIDFANGTQGKRVDNQIYRSQFDPSSPKSVWTGSSVTGVPMSSLSESGPGLYLVSPTSGSTYFIFVQSESVSAFNVAFTLDSDVIDQVEFRPLDNGFRIRKYNPSGLVSEQEITAIYKV